MKGKKKSERSWFCLKEKHEEIFEGTSEWSNTMETRKHFGKNEIPWKHDGVLRLIEIK